MAKIDDYRAAFDLAAAELIKKGLDQTAQVSGAEIRDGRLALNFMDLDCLVGLDPVEVTRPDGPPPPLTDQVLILHYLTKADGRPVSGEWISYREFPGGENYFPVFQSKATIPLVGFFGDNPQTMAEVAAELGGRPGRSGDASAVFEVFPRLPMQAIIWAGDDEFPAEGNILLDKSAAGYLSPEDIVWAAGRLVKRLVSAAQKRSGK